MIKNYLTIAWRNVSRHTIHSIINVSSLALGMVCCLFIFLWVRDERSIDNFHENGQNIYTLYQVTTANGKVEGSYSLDPGIVNDRYAYNKFDDIHTLVPEIEGLVYYKTGYELPWGHPEAFRVGEKKLRLEGSRASADFFKVFSFPMLAGDRLTALNDIGNITISREMAEIFFGSPANAIGKTVRYEDRQDFVVTGVFENIPKESSLRFDFLINWEAQKKGIVEYSSQHYDTYVTLKDKADPAVVTRKVNDIMQGRSEKKAGISIALGMQRFGDEYLHNIFVNGQPVDGRIQYVRIFSGVAVFILLIACINFMNLTTARSVRRAKEIGLRKVVGSSRAQLIGQFLGEAIVYAFLAMVLSIALLLLFLPLFNKFTGKSITSPLSMSSMWLALAGLMTVTGLVAGIYPALYLSSLKPVRVLKGVLRFSQGSILFRKGLTVFQFVLSIFLIIATVVITGQTQYVQQTHLGYDRENLLYVRIDGELLKIKKYLLFKQEAVRMPGIAMIDRCTEEPHAMNFVEADNINWEGKPRNVSVGFKPASVGFDYVRLMKMEIAEGRDFSKDIATDSSDAFLVNEEAVRQMGIQHPIGKWVSAWKKRGHIVGILKDYHTQSLREPIKPVILDIKEYEDFGVVLIRTQAGKTREALSSLEKVYKDVNPNYPLEVQFVDTKYKQLYASELIISKLSILFSSLAIAISCLGLLGLVIFSAEQRVKEIGIRKVLGASLRQIVVLFSRDFLGLIAIAFLIAAPLGGYFMHSWLKDFSYRISLSWWIFALAGGAAVGIAMLTISWQAMRAANANPVKSLRSE